MPNRNSKSCTLNPSFYASAVGALEASLCHAGCSASAAEPTRAKLRVLTRKVDDLAVAAIV